MEFLEKKVLSEKDDDNPDPTPTDPLLSESIPLENLNSTSKPRRSCPEVYRNSSTVTSPKRKIPLKSAISAPLIHELALECSQSSRNKTVEIVPKTDPEEPNYNQRFVPRLYASRIGTLPVAVYPAWLLRVLCVAVSIAVGLISFLWFFVLIELALIPSGVIGGTVALLLLVFLNLGNRFQCSGALVGPLFGTKHGRIVLLTLVSSILLAGPVSNIVVNANEITKGFSCVSDAVKNETQALKMLMAKPYEILNKQIVESVDTWTRTSAKFTGKLKSATREVGRIQESTEHLIKTARSYMEICNKSLGDLQGTCKNKVNLVNEQCTAFVKSLTSGNVINTIKDTVGGQVSGIQDTLNSLLGKGKGKGKSKRVKRGIEQLCEAFKIDGLCQTLPAQNLCKIGSVDELIQSVDTISTSVAATMSEMDKMMAFKVNTIKSMDVSAVKKVAGVDSFNITQTASLIGKSENIKRKIGAITVTITVLKVTLSCAVLALLIEAWIYLSNYMISNEFDNNFITKDLVEMDAKLAEAEQDGYKSNIFPLSKLEERSYQDFRQNKLNSDEKSDIYKGLLLVGGNVVLGSFLFGFDDLLCWVMDFLKEFSSAFSFTEFIDQQGMKYTFEGGFMAGFIQKFISGFTDFYQSSSMSEMSSCLPSPNHLDIKFYIATGLLYIVILALTIAQPYCVRYLHMVADNFYPDRKTARLIFLLEKIQLDRLRDRSELKRKVETNLTETERKERLNPVNNKLMKSYRREQYRFRCLLCSSKLASGHLDTILCLTPGCKGLYCRNCLTQVLKGVCVLCERHPNGRSVEHLDQLEWTKVPDD